jgi:zinc/manganese transport system substrate-binding protein
LDVRSSIVPRPRAVLGLLAALAWAGPAACSAGVGSTRTADPTGCPAAVLSVVVSVGQWGDLVRTLAGDCADVTTIVDSSAVDPHDFEPTTGDLAAFEDADLVVVNGAGYDHWAGLAVAGLDPQPRVVDAAEVVAARGTGGDAVDPHLWYSPDDVQRTGAAVTDALSALAPAASGYFAGRAADWAATLAPYRDEVTALRAQAAGCTYAATETVFDLMAATLGLTDATPAGYRVAASNESDPAPGDLAAFEAALSDGSIDVLVVNTQTEGNVPGQLRRAAEQAGVPVVEVTESAPAGESSFATWQLDQLRQLSAALGEAR